MAKLTPPLQRLHTPSKRMMGRLSCSNTCSAMGCQSKSTTDENDVFVGSVDVGLGDIDRCLLADTLTVLSTIFCVALAMCISSLSFLAPFGLIDATSNGEITSADDEKYGKPLLLTIPLLLLRHMQVEKAFVQQVCGSNKWRRRTNVANSCNVLVDEERLFLVVAIAAGGNRRDGKRKESFLREDSVS